MRPSWFQVLPALLAAFLICVLPSCASAPDGLFDAAYAQAVEESRPVINHDLKPLPEGVPSGIQRGAGMDFDPPACDGDLWPLAVFYLILYVGYGFVWCCVKAVEAIVDACRSPAPDECEECENDSEEDAEESSESQSP